jgi:hypothetical protein
MQRIRHAGDERAWGIGLGGSYGDAKVVHLKLLGRNTSDELHGSVWANAELFFERRFPSGQLARIHVGAGKPLRTASCDHVTDAGRGLFGDYHDQTERECTQEEMYQVVPYFGFSLGKAF